MAALIQWLAVAEHLSFPRAALALGSSRSSVGTRISSIAGRKASHGSIRLSRGDMMQRHLVRGHPQHLHQRAQGCGRLAAAGVIEKETRIRRAPIFEHANEAARSEVFADMLLRRIG